MFLQDTVQDTLDELASSRTSLARKGIALDTLERLLAELCTGSKSHKEPSNALLYFIALQDTFQCNVPSRLISWISETTPLLETLIGKGSIEDEKETEVSSLSSQLMQALSIVQGIALIHFQSKQWLGRRYALEILLHLFMVSRHVPSTSNSAPSNSGSNNTPHSLSLSSTVLDTLLCILVDSSPALRVFEQVNGVQYVVRILKRAGTPREVRMKCLEFLYFYLLDETSPSFLADSFFSTDPPSMEPPSPEANPTKRATSPIAMPTAPSSPSSLNTSTNTSTRSLTSSTDLSDSPSSSYSSSSSSSTWDSRTSIDTSDHESSSTYVTSFSPSSFDGTSTPLEASPLAKGAGLKQPSNQNQNAAKPRSLLMLRKEVDFVPISPKKAQITKLGVGTPRSLSSTRTPSKPQPQPERGLLTPRNRDDVRPSGHHRMHSLQFQSFQTPQKPSSLLSHTPLKQNPTSPSLLSTPTPATKFQKGHRRGQSSVDVQNLVPLPPSVPLNKSGARTMEEKKEILGSLLGNVDALVDGVRKAGIWGLS